MIAVSIRLPKGKNGIKRALLNAAPYVYAFILLF